MSGKGILRDLRKGIPPHMTLHIGDYESGFDVAVSVISAEKCLEIEELTQEYCSGKENRTNKNVQDQFYNALLCMHCMRDVNDLTQPVAESVQEVLQYLDLEDINRVVNAYSELMVNKAPKLELMTDVELTEIKKYLEVTPLSGLSTVSLVHLANFRQTIALGL